MTLPILAFEASIAEVLAVSPPQLRFAVCLFACVPVGWCQRQIRNLIVATGLLLIYIPFGSAVLNAVPPALFTFAALHLCPAFCGTLVWLFCFPHLVYMHFINASGATWQAGAMDATGALMILFLKLVAVAQCRQDATKLQKGEVNERTAYQRQKMIQSSPSLLEFLSYLFCFGHLLSGPFTEFKDYKNYIERRDLWSQELPPRGLPFLRSFAAAVLYLAVFVVMGSLYPFTVYFTEDYMSASLVEKFMIATFVGACYRLRYYFAWGVAEAASVASGFGYNGKNGGENGTAKARWDRCRNVTVMETELATSFARIPAYWNTCTGMFLRRYVYDRLTAEGGKPTFFTLLATQLVSALWHGLYPGYFLFFASSAMAIASSKVLHRWELKNSISEQPWYKLIKLVYTGFTLNYAASAFLILSFKESIEVYASMKFVPHVVMALIVVLGRLFARPKMVAAK